MWHSRLRKENQEVFDLVSKRAMQLSDHGYIEVYTDPREKIWAHSYAANLTAEEVLFGAHGGEQPPQQFPPEPESAELVSATRRCTGAYGADVCARQDFNEPGSWWQYCVLDANGQAGEYHGG